jgi:superfamily I DNA and/or RNA helicase
LQQAAKKIWIVYAKKPFAGPEQVLEYLGRYTHRIAISNHRIKSMDNGKVTFTYRNRRQNNQLKEITLSAMEFIRRFLLHVLPFRFMKIRYYGFLANIYKKKSILLIRRLIGVDMEARIFIEETLQEKVLRLTGKDITLCPHCKIGRMVYLALLPGANTS